MPLPIIDNVWRVAIPFTGTLGINPVNIFHVVCATDDATAVGGHIDDAKAAMVSAGFNPWRLMTSSYSTEFIELIKLDGTSPTQLYHMTNQFVGQSGGEIVPEAAGVVGFHTGQRGPRGRGRMFIGPARESMIADGLVDGSWVSDALGGFNAFVLSLAESDCAMTVASYAHRDHHEVTSVHPSPKVATQRRRLLATR